MAFQMTQEELDQVGIFEKLKEKAVSQKDAARILGLSVRQVKRKLRAFKQKGAGSLMHAARGKPGNRTHTQALKEKALTLVKQNYPDFGPTLAAEKLVELHSLMVNKETLRQWMSEMGIWKPKKERVGSVHVWRERRVSLGDLVQLDGSEHDWLEGRAPKCCLLAFIDDATSMVLYLEFCESESTESLFTATRHYLESKGRPVSIYTDRGGVYKVNLGNEEGERVTQFERVLGELGIGLIHARSPQAKGRVERLFGTLQDRLIKELRIQGISNLQEANRFLKSEYLPAHNRKFAVVPKNPTNLHRSLEAFDLSHIFSRVSIRQLQNDWCLSYQNRWLQVEPRQRTVLSRKAEVEIREHQSGELHLWYHGVKLSFKELLERPPKPLREKLPDLRHIGHKPLPIHPWRKYPPYLKRDISKLLERDISILV